ncbi:MAG TPA: glycosyltransferase family 2 protein [Planctomycetota bacterium]|nr:glycosyltransferase family 2 protein [Planctomycetota bacterium]
MTDVPANAPPPAAARVAVVVLNWNGLAFTRACLRSLFAQTWPSLEIHVVDNGSRDDEAAALCAEFGGRIRMHALPHNAGFTGGCNVAMQTVLAAGNCEFVALLNNDAEAEVQWVEALVREAGRDERTGLVASRMCLFDEPDALDNAGVWLLSNGDVAPRGRLQRAASWNRANDLLAACGGAVLLRCSMLRRIGLFRADFFANFEDADLSLRAVVAGHRVRYAPDAVVRHHLNATIRRIRDTAFNVRSVRNATWVFFVNLPLPVLLLDLPWFVLGNLAIVLLMPLCGRPAVAWAFVRGRLWALRELPAIAAERRRLRPLRAVSWWRLWCMQRNFLWEYGRLVLLRVRGRRVGFMASAPAAAGARPPIRR